MFKNLDLIGYIVVTLFFAPLFLVALSGPIDDWLNAREKRKKAAAADADSAASPAAHPAAEPA